MKDGLGLKGDVINSINFQVKFEISESEQLRIVCHYTSVTFRLDHRSILS